MNDYDGGWHNCHFCGTYVKEGFENSGERHWLSDCRPDLVEHELGKLCTWHKASMTDGCTHSLDRIINDEVVLDEHLRLCVSGCYSYQDRDTLKWTDEHINFYEDGPM